MYYIYRKVYKETQFLNNRQRSTQIDHFYWSCSYWSIMQCCLTLNFFLGSLKLKCSSHITGGHKDFLSFFGVRSCYLSLFTLSQPRGNSINPLKWAKKGLKWLSLEEKMDKLMDAWMNYVWMLRCTITPILNNLWYTQSL